jgi:hypothetical protein
MRGEALASARHEEPRLAAREPSIGTPRGEISETARFLLGVIERMELGPFQLGESAESELLVIDVTGSAARELATGDGAGRCPPGAREPSGKPR